MPNIIDPIAVKSGSTEVTVLTTARVLQNVTFGSAVAQPIEVLTASSTGVVPSTMVAYGISRVSVAAGDLSTSPRLAYLAAPITGVEKTIVFATTAAYINTLDIDIGESVAFDDLGTTNSRYIRFSTLGTQFQSITMIGLSTALWMVKSVNSTVGNWGAATGIRPSSIASTS